MNLNAVSNRPEPRRNINIIAVVPLKRGTDQIPRDFVNFLCPVRRKITPSQQTNICYTAVYHIIGDLKFHLFLISCNRKTSEDIQHTQTQPYHHRQQPQCMQHYYIILRVLVYFRCRKNERTKEPLPREQ